MKTVAASSLDPFNLPRWLLALSEIAKCYFWCNTVPEIIKKTNIISKRMIEIDFLMKLFCRFPMLQYKNIMYDFLVRQTDIKAANLAYKIKPDLHIGLSGTCFLTHKAVKESQGVTVVECGSTHPRFQTSILSEEFRRCNAFPFLFPKRYLKQVEDELLQCDKVQLASNFAAKTFVDCGFPPEKIFVVGRGFCNETFTPKPITRLNHKFRFFCPSLFNYRKGARVLIEAWRLLNTNEAELHWIGNHPEKYNFFGKQPPNILFHEWTNQVELARLFQCSDVMVLPSFEEGFARVILEVAGCGLPVIATPNTGVEDFFTDGHPEGWLIPCNDPTRLAEAMSEAISNKKSTIEKGAIAAKRAHADFTWEKYSLRVINHYKEFISN